MANYDAGHYFLTVMAPIDRNAFVERDGVRRSAIDHTRHFLTTLPTAQQDFASAASGLQSPFARVPGTHFAHIFIVEDTRYNGRRPSNPIFDLIKNVQMTVPEKVDHLPDAYVALVVDFDAQSGDDLHLRAYTDSLWDHMRDELQHIFAQAIGFETVANNKDFFEFVKAGQITTTMPFNDYWTCPIEPPNPLPWMTAASALIFLGTVLLATTGVWTASLWGLWGVWLLVTLAVNIALVVKFGLTPFAPAPDSDLQSVLKALYVQQMFTGFAMDHLGHPPEKLKADFDAFCDIHKPDDLAGPHQPPGVLTTKWTGS